MDSTTPFVINVVSMIAAVIAAVAGGVAAAYAIIAVREAKRIALSQANLQSQIANIQEGQQRRREALQACIELRDLLDRWYRTLREKINPNQSPEQILRNITELNEHRQFQHDYSTFISRIRAAHEPLCDPLLQGAAQTFHDSALGGKRGISERFRQNLRLRGLHPRRWGGQANEEADRAYVEAVLEGLRNLYFGADDELARVITQLSEQIHQPLPALPG